MINHKTKFRRTSRACMPPADIHPCVLLQFSLRHSLQKMKLHHSRMLQDLSRKQEALSLEQRSLNTRSRLTSTSSTDNKNSALVVPLANSSGRSNLQLLAQWEDGLNVFEGKKSNSYFKFNLFNPAVINKQWTHKTLRTLSVKVIPKEKKQTHSSCKIILMTSFLCR